jgi:hypothetical protein
MYLIFTRRIVITQTDSSQIVNILLTLPQYYTNEGNNSSNGNMNAEFKAQIVVHVSLRAHSLLCKVDNDIVSD